MFQPAIDENVYRSLISRIAAIERNVGDDADNTAHDLERYSGLLEQVVVNIARLRSSLSDNNWNDVDARCNHLRSTIDDKLYELDLINPVSAAPVRQRGGNGGGRGGRPKKEIDKVKLQMLLDTGFGLKKIADEELLGFPIHRNTISSFIKKNDMKSPRQTYATISDADLSLIIPKNIVTIMSTLVIERLLPC